MCYQGAVGTAPRAWLIIVAVAASGCYRSHGRAPGADAGPQPVDAGRPPRRDGGRDAGRDAGLRGGSYWALEPRVAQVSFPHELGCAQVAGGSLAIRVTATIASECEHAGPVEVEERADGTFVVHAFVWVEHRASPGECPGIADQMERIVLVEARGGRARVEDALSGASAEIDVGLVDGGPCGGGGDRGAACIRDCDCRSGLRCVPDLGDFVECFGGRCGDPCNLLGSAVSPVYPRNLDCPPTLDCARTGGASPTCVRTPDLCTEDAQCRDGLECPVRDLMDCEWSVVLSSTTRHPCAGDDDCDRGMYCVEHAGGERRCDVPCFTNDMRCPAMHACQPRAGWVCEWLGE